MILIERHPCPCSITHSAPLGLFVLHNEDTHGR